MTVWRPAPRIRVKALGLVWCEGRLLAAEVPDDAGRVKGVRPLGGSVEFGETAEAAVIREFQEELGVTITVLGGPRVIENLYTHEGTTGHEVLFIFDAALPDGAFAGQDSILFHEDDGTPCTARWFAPNDLDRPGGPALFPQGLLSLLPPAPPAAGTPA